jgi:hypothetical protein
MKLKIYMLDLRVFEKLPMIQDMERAGELSEHHAWKARKNVWSKVGYDVYVAFVIAASNEKQARLLAQEVASSAAPPGDEIGEGGRWRDPKLTSCRVVGEALEGAKESVILADFRNG